MTAETKWTPGPWRVGIDGRLIFTDDDKCVAAVKGEVRNPTAHAILIAAAPDLYAALAECVAAAVEAHPKLGLDGRMHLTPPQQKRAERLARARAALVRARGEQP